MEIYNKYKIEHTDRGVFIAMENATDGFMLHQ
jgi:hypothetical protein